MSASFSDLYSKLSKSVFQDQARQQLDQGSDALTRADTYAELGKPDFVLAFLLLAEVSDEVKRTIFARSYERRAEISEARAAEFDRRFHRSFPLIKLEAQRDRAIARQVYQGQRLDTPPSTR
ncbi:MAG: hypothetical protein J2P37_01335 [Ktedonobacteraceae bacterium]|nr:hypothetical protein [Ktedonobacteraceae bacterium]MBO0790576.1 hypothetical protein [Ktedonobacteraceae bacterium]